MRGALQIWLVLNFLILFFSPCSFAECHFLLSVISSSDHEPSPKVGTSVEVETTFQAALEMGIRNGTLGRLATSPAAREIIQEWQQREAAADLANSEPNEIPLYRFPHGLLLRLLQLEALKRFPGKLVGEITSNEIDKSFRKNRTFAGLEIQPTRKVPARVLPEVEHQGFFTLETLLSPNPADIFNRYVEFHVRGKKGELSAGQVYESALSIVAAAERHKKGYHAHLVADLPLKALAEKGLDQVAAMTDFSRRVEIALQIYQVLVGAPLHVYLDKDRKDPEAAFVRGPRREGNAYGSLFSDLALLQQNPKHPPKIGDRYKGGFFGVHFEDKYDEKGVWGGEVRVLSQQRQNDYNLLNAIQARLASNDYLVPLERLRAWAGLPVTSRERFLFFFPVSDQSRRAKEKQRWEEKFNGSYYNLPYDTLAKQAPRAIQAILSKETAGGKTLLNYLIEKSTSQRRPIHSERFVEMKMLIHDWATDPLYFDQPEKLAKIEAIQLRELEKLKQDPQQEPYYRVVQFLQETGIAEDYFRSLGLSFKPVLSAQP